MDNESGSGSGVPVASPSPRIGFWDLQRLLNSHPEFRSVGLTVCENLEKIKEIQDGYNYREEGIGATMAAYLGVSAFGLFANFFTLVIMFNACNLRRSRNYLIVSHMFTDCFQSSITMPITLLMTFHFFWDLDDFTCKLASFAKAASFYSSYMTLGVLAAHQHISLHWQQFNPHVFISIFVACGIFAAPYVFAVSTETVNYFEPWNENEIVNRALRECNMTRPMLCSESRWDRVPFSQQSYMFTTLIMLYAMPIMGLFLSYKACKDWRKMKHEKLEQFCEINLKNKENFMMLSCLVFIYLLHWLPMTLFTFLHFYELVDFTYNRYLIFQTIGVSPAIFKPIVYGLTNSAIRDMYLDTVRSICCPFGLCAQPSKSPLRRLIRLGMGAEDSEMMSYVDDEIDDVFDKEPRRFKDMKLYRAQYYAPSSFIDRRAIYSRPIYRSVR